MKRALAFLLLTATLPAQIHWWTGTWEAALEEAAARNVPIMVAFVMDDEEANDRIVSGLYTDKQFHRALERAIPVMASMNTHKPKEQKVSGKSVSVCGKFGYVKCGTHRAIEREVRTTFFPTGHVKTPYHFVILPDETKVEGLHDVHGTSAYVDALERGQRKLGGRGLSSKEYRRSLDLLANARRSLGASDFLATAIHLDELEKIAGGTPIGKEAAEVRRSWTKAGTDIGTRAQELADQGEWVEALRLVRDGGAAFKGSPLQRSLKKVEGKLAKTKEGRIASRILKSETRAKPSFDQGVSFEEQRDYVKAVKAYYRVLNLASGSPLARKARTRLDDLTSDRDIAPLVKRTVAVQEGELALKSARTLLRKQPDEGRAALRKIIDDWPKTPAATKAKKLLQTKGPQPEQPE